jgi:hypothetical protein
MKIIIDINASGKVCGGCFYRVSTVPYNGLVWGIKPSCLIFRKEVPDVNGEAPRLAECIAAEQSEINISIDDIETFTKEEDWE